MAAARNMPFNDFHHPHSPTTPYFQERAPSPFQEQPQQPETKSEEPEPTKEVPKKSGSKRRRSTSSPSTKRLKTEKHSVVICTCGCQQRWIVDERTRNAMTPIVACEQKTTSMETSPTTVPTVPTTEDTDMTTTDMDMEQDKKKTYTPTLDIKVYEDRINKMPQTNLAKYSNFYMSDYNLTRKVLSKLTPEETALVQTTTLLTAKQIEDMLQIADKTMWCGFYIKAWFAKRRIPLGRLVDEATEEKNGVKQYVNNSQDELQKRENGQMLFLGIMNTQAGPDGTRPKKSELAPKNGAEYRSGRPPKVRGDGKRKKPEQKQPEQPEQQLQQPLDDEHKQSESEPDVDEERAVSQKRQRIEPPPPPPSVNPSASKKSTSPKKNDKNGRSNETNMTRTQSQALQNQITNKANWLGL